MAETVIWSDLHPDLKVGANGDIKLVENVEAVYASIENILLTIKGERVMLRTFALNFNALLFEPLLLDVLRDRYVREFKDAIEYWEPRVKISNLDFKADTERQTLYIRIEMYIVGYDKIFTLEKQYKI